MMKRDLELIRKLLLFFDEKGGHKHIEVPPIDGYDANTIKHHLVLLNDAGWLRCEPVKSKTSDRVIYVLPFELTWEGHELLDKIRNQAIWDAIHAEVKRKGFESISMDIIRGIADMEIRRQFNL
jgi:hypothetical protein